MTRIIVLVLGIILFMGSTALANRLALTDNTLITGEMLSCVASSKGKYMRLTGATGDTFAMYENGVNVFTYKLTAADSTAGGANFNFSHAPSTYKIDWSGATDTVTMYCYE